MKRYCLALDLKPDAEAIAQYRRHHEKIWPEITSSIRQAEIRQMEIWLIGNRLFMIMDTEDSFTFERKSWLDSANPKVLEWEELMWNYQQGLPQAKPGEKWMIMEKIFDLSEQ